MRIPNLKITYPVKLFLFLWVIFVSNWIFPQYVCELIYTLSINAKIIIIFFIPIIVFLCIYNAVISIERNIGALFILIILLVIINSYASSLWSYTVMLFISPNLSTRIIAPPSNILKVLWELNLPPLVPNQYAVLSALIVGTIIKNWKPNFIINTLSEEGLKKVYHFIMFYVIKPLLPFVILGLLMNSYKTGFINIIINDFLWIFCINIIVQSIYIIILYAIAAKFRFNLFLFYIINMSSAAFTAFSTASSIISMPETLKACKKNVMDKKDINLADLYVPATVNAHLTGDSISTPLIAILTLVCFNQQIPSLDNFLIFIAYMIVGRFASAGLPGGTALVTIALLQSYYAFSSDMVSFLLTIEYLLDPFITATNVLGNGAIFIIYKKTLKIRQFSLEKKLLKE